jgi:hypothetical protein
VFGSPTGVVSAANPFPVVFGAGATLPAFATTPTVNLGTLGGAATAAAQATGNGSLSSISSLLNNGATHLTTIYVGLVGTIQYPFTGTGKVERVQCYNFTGTVPAYVQMFDVASGATLGASVVDYVPLAPGGSNGFTLLNGVYYANGFGLGAATTPGGSTAVNAGTVNCTVNYRTP